MADHWVSELFPPTFEFSIKDLLCKTPQSENQQKLFSKDDESKAKYDLYERVYQEMDEKIPHQQPSDASDLYEDGKHFEDVVHIPKSKKHDGKRGHKSRKDGMKKLSKEEEDCIWSRKELWMLRKYFQKTKLQNIQLAAMLQNSECQVKEWKEKFELQAESTKILKEKLQQVTRQHKTLKVSFKAMKEDLKKYHSKLKLENQHIRELQTERSHRVTEINSLRSEFNMERFQKEKLQRILGNKEEEVEGLIADRGFMLKQQFSLEIATLKKEIAILTNELEKEKEENSLNKKALEKLRMYFADLQCKGLEEEPVYTREPHLLSVVDIDYLSL